MNRLLPLKIFAFHIFFLTWLPFSQAGNLACEGQFEGKTVKMIVPFEGGGGYDTYARLFAPHYESITGAKVLVENWPAGKGLVGVRKIMDAAVDGLTFGIMNAPKRAVDKLLSESDVPDLLNDFTILARIARSRHVLLVGAQSAIPDFRALLTMDPRPVFGSNNLRTGGLLSTVLIGDLLGMEFDVVSGLGGTRKRVLAAARGDVDIISSNFYSVLPNIESGDIRPILQISSARIDDHSSLDDVPVLGGDSGLAASLADQLNIEVEDAIARVRNIETLTAAGRLFVAPANLPGELESCLQDAFLATLQDENFIDDTRKANMLLDVADGPSARTALVNDLSGLQQLLPVLKQRMGEM